MKKIHLFFIIIAVFNSYLFCASKIGGLIMPTIKAATIGGAFYAAGKAFNDVNNSLKKIHEQGLFEKVLSDKSFIEEFVELNSDNKIIFNEPVQQSLRKSFANLIPASEYQKIDRRASDILAEFYFVPKLEIWGASRYKGYKLIAISKDGTDQSIEKYYGRVLFPAERDEVYLNNELLAEIIVKENAFALRHEIGHLVLDHARNGESSSILDLCARSLGSAALAGVITKNIISNRNLTMLQLIKKNLIIGSFGLASHLLIKYRQQKRSRDNECEADDFALRYTNLAQELRDGITFLDDQSVELKGFIERLFASHPSTKLRKEKIEKRLAEILGQPKS